MRIRIDGLLKLWARVRMPAALAVVALAVVPASDARLPAGFKHITVYTYKAVYEGSGSYTHTISMVSVHASFKWKVTIPMITLLPKQLSTPGTGGGLRSAGGGAGKLKEDGITGQWDVSVTGTPPCSGSGGFKPSAAPVAQAYINPLVKGGYVIDLFPSFSGIPVDEKPKGAQDCADIGGPLPSDFWHDWPANEGVGNTTFPFVATVHVKPSKEGKVVDQVGPASTERPPPNCQCTYRWKGTLTLTRLKTSGK
jgi:hypothetical protein